ncbi:MULTISPECIES: ExeA family protein [unclassified Polaromonas]|uniref:ExeA family protein n=1 Tax=unclassified Polaromonas TaxID=2638319 RepID=UPI0018C9C4C0|nr:MULTISPECIES: ExeA family protein [unclassified Polaromonas]MBG6071040.1 general secretion pathway protein A [Polaromonas sp. CG_9.7]MBG6113040.1 general secretion pathway protein A [Polaromonas sp. CG_9.2]MDH6185572.1 general secretion pathway protein A [Polaromonas sp. CG_23.6]
MYEHHFGLSQDPFSIAPDPRYLFMSERHREALAHLLYGVAGPHGAGSGTGGGFVLLTGDIGTGKTTICRCFMEQIPAGCHVAYIFNPKLTVTELLQSVCEEFHITAAAATASGAPTVKDYIDALNSFLLKSHAAGESSVLIIDEAQNLSADVLEQLRLLTNLETSERKLLQIVLIGQPELRTLLARPEMEQLAQRVIARFHLDALTEAESAQYIEHRLSVAGFTGPLPFDRSAIQRIHRLTRGVPRRINLLCGRALLGAWANGLFRVNRPVVDKAAVEVFGLDAGQARGVGKRPVSYALGGLALLAGAVVAGFLLVNPAQKELAPSLASSAPAPQAGASSPEPEKPPALRPAEELDTLVAQFPADINTAWRALAPAWKLPASDGDPCLAASAQQLQCYRTSNLSVPLLRQLDRPGILTLHTGNGPPVHAILVGLDDQTATLQDAAGLHTVRLVSLGRLWRGEFATYWRPPPGYTPGLQGDSAVPVIRQLASQLAVLEGAPVPLAYASPPLLDTFLRARVRAFQRAQGLEADGQPGPLTFMQIDSATNANAPHLQTQPPSLR